MPVTAQQLSPNFRPTLAFPSWNLQPLRSNFGTQSTENNRAEPTNVAQPLNNALFYYAIKQTIVQNTLLSRECNLKRESGAA